MNLLTKLVGILKSLLATRQLTILGQLDDGDWGLRLNRECVEAKDR